MKLFWSYSWTLLVLILACCQTSIPEDVEQAYQNLPVKVDFNFHIKPILSDRCYKCHGPDNNARKAELRLDLEEEAFSTLKKDGGHAFVAGNVGKSVAWQRITSYDPDFHMPPPESNLALSAKEKALITKWIEQGAEWKEHWAFIPPQEPEIPQDFPNNWKAYNPVDNFIYAELKEQGLSPSPETDKEHLIRRLSFDLTGLPPTIQEIDGFLADDDPRGYEELVDRLLATDSHAERMALEWLDVARYGDSQGMHLDALRYHWPWRDWVIKAFKENMPYDDFIIWQLAGDLLPDATREQKLATAFQRNHPVTAEGGAINEEFRQKYVQDRTNTTATAFLGLTLECATCHDHKFDPILQKEYYQMTAFFNNLSEIGMVAEHGRSSGPVLLLPDPESEKKLVQLSGQIDQTIEKMKLTRSQVAATKEFVESVGNLVADPPMAQAVYPFESLRPKKIEVDEYINRVLLNNPLTKIVDENPKSLSCGEPQVVPGKFGNGLRFPEEFDLVFFKGVGNFEINEPFSAGGWIKTEKDGELQTIMGTSGDLISYWRGWDLLIDSLNRPSVQMTSYWPHNYMQVTSDVAIPKEEWFHVFFTYDGSGMASGLQLYVNGERTKISINQDNLYRTILHEWKPFYGWKERPVIVGRSGRYWTGENGVFTGSMDNLKIFSKFLTPLEVATVVQSEEGLDPGNPRPKLSDDDYLDHYLNRKHPEYQSLVQELRRLVADKLKVMEDVGEIMVMEDMPQTRKTYVLNRGQYNEPTEEVGPGTPAKVLTYGEDLPKNRLGLAQWLVDPKNPLTARVTVNRYWQMIFGTGIVETPHDFGTQGALPTHPELLDWLALRFIESGWDVKELLKTLVISATYQQSSVATPLHMEKDAKNLYLARGPSYRLPAEMIRDNALAASGLLTQKVGGASVKPYQPEGLWLEKNGFDSAYRHSSGESLYRRSMYTLIRRTMPSPAMIAFDATNRSVCIVKRENTNTPLQALVLLNDPQFVEAARVLAERIQKESGEELSQQAVYAFRLVTGRKPTKSEVRLLMEQYKSEISRFREEPESAEQLLNIGEYPLDKNLDKTQTAALAMVANTLLNHDGAYMKR